MTKKNICNLTLIALLVGMTTMCGQQSNVPSDSSHSSSPTTTSNPTSSTNEVRQKAQDIIQGKHAQETQVGFTFGLLYDTRCSKLPNIGNSNLQDRLLNVLYQQGYLTMEEEWSKIPLRFSTLSCQVGLTKEGLKQIDQGWLSLRMEETDKSDILRGTVAHQRFEVVDVSVDESAKVAIAICQSLFELTALGRKMFEDGSFNHQRNQFRLLLRKYEGGWREE